jgi:hypothetical protein
MTDEELIAEMTTRGLTAPPANLSGIHDVTLRAELARRGLLLKLVFTDSELQFEAERRNLVGKSCEQIDLALKLQSDRIRREHEASCEQIDLALKLQSDRIRREHEAKLSLLVERCATFEHQRDDWIRRYRELSDRRPMGFFSALRALWAAVWRRGVPP